MKNVTKIMAIIGTVLLLVCIIFRTVPRPNEPNESNMVSMAYVFDYEPLTTITIDCEDGNGVVIDYGGDEVVVTGANEEGAKIFFEYVKKYMDAYLESKAEPNDEIGEIVFEITDIPVPEALITFTGDGHNICLGEDAGLYLTDESCQFVVNVGGKMLQTTMTPEEYQMIYDVVNRAANEVKE